MPKCPGCGTPVAKEGDACGDCLDAALPVVLAAEDEGDGDEEQENER